MKSPYIFILLISICLQTYSQVKIEKPKTRNFSIPRYFIGKSDVYIYGPFDGDGSNTFIRFENNRTESFEVKPLMESKTKILFKIPETYGEYELIIADEGTRKAMFKPVNVILLQTEYDEFYYRKKRSKFYARLLGSELIDDEYNFGFINKSPHVINIVGGNRQQKIIKSTKGEELVWEGEMLRLNKQDARFLIMFNIDQPAADIEVQAE